MDLSQRHQNEPTFSPIYIYRETEAEVDRVCVHGLVTHGVYFLATPGSSDTTVAINTPEAQILVFIIILQ